VLTRFCRSNTTICRSLCSLSEGGSTWRREYDHVNISKHAHGPKVYTVGWKWIVHGPREAAGHSCRELKLEILQLRLHVVSRIWISALSLTFVAVVTLYEDRATVLGKSRLPIVKHPRRWFGNRGLISAANRFLVDGQASLAGEAIGDF
jgi:hypothetical protein